MEMPLKVLIIEDDSEYASLIISEIMGKRNYVSDYKLVDNIYDMKNTLLLKEKKFDVIITDYFIRGSTAFDVLEFIREKEIDIPVIIVSESVGEEIAVGLIKAGAKDIVMKSNLSRLMPIIERELKEAKIQQEKKLTLEELKNEKTLFKTFYDLSTMMNENIKKLEKYIVDEAIKLTKSKMGFIGLVDESKGIVTINQFGGFAMESCKVVKKDPVYPIENSGFWAESIRQRKPFVINDYQKFPSKKYLPNGHIPIARFLSIPVIYNGKITMIVNVGNKEEEYNKTDIQQLQQLMNNIWVIIQQNITTEQLKTSIAEKETLIKEIHHRVKNNLQIISSLLNLQAKGVQDKRYFDMFKDSQNRIKTMALVHEKLYQSGNFSSINTSHYTNSIVTNLFHSYGVNTSLIELDMKVDNIVLDIDTAIPFGLIINEIITNSIKYAFPNDRRGKIFIYFSSDEKKFNLTIGDTGKGIPFEVNFENINSLGLQLIDALVKQLEGTIKLDNTNGASYNIEFKKTSKEKIY